MPTTSLPSRASSTASSALLLLRPSWPRSSPRSTMPVWRSARSLSGSSTLLCVSQPSFRHPFMVRLMRLIPTWPTDLLKHVQVCVQRYYQRHEPRMRHRGLRRAAWLGPCHGHGYAQLPQVACPLAPASLSRWISGLSECVLWTFCTVGLSCTMRYPVKLDFASSFHTFSPADGW